MTTLPEQAAHLLQTISALYQLHEENPFKIRAFEKAALAVASCPDLLALAQAQALSSLPGVGAATAQVLSDFLLHHKTPLKDELEKSLPPGLIELTQLKGLGPKKAKTLIQQLGLTSPQELEYACLENRLLTLKGFGAKAQANLLQAAREWRAYQSLRLLPEALAQAASFCASFQAHFPGVRIEPAGALRRQREVLDNLSFLVLQPATTDADHHNTSVLLAFCDTYRSQHPETLPLQLSFCDDPQAWGSAWVQATGSSAHWQALGQPAAAATTTQCRAASESEFYQRLGLPFVAPELRETGAEVALARSAGGLAGLPAAHCLRGIFHHHTTASDGSASLEEMVIAAKTLGYQYIGISDHSQSAVYARGLRLSDLQAQKKELDQVQERHPEIQLFWGIESDILEDGSLDYPDACLREFDFVIASIHSRFQMDASQMTRRLLKALAHPATRFLGHPTGRLLLGRKGYEFDREAIVTAAKKHQVALEFNAHPSRLDCDWHWGPLIREKQAWIAVNPDAHSPQDLNNTPYGLLMARKGLIPSSLIVNTQTPQQVAQWLKRAF